jgi:hypothetical protein
MYIGFLERGFRELGADVHRKPNRKNRGFPHYITPIDIEDHGLSRRVWWDWSDFSDLDPRMKTRCGKVELKTQNLGRNYVPTAQVVPSTLLDNLDSLLAEGRCGCVRSVYCVCRATAFEHRRECVEALRRWGGGLAMAALTPRPNRPLVPLNIAGFKLDQLDNYREQVRSQITVAPWGIGQKTWRHMETLALGRCLVMPETDRAWPADYSRCAVTVKPDWSDLHAKLNWLVSHDAAREEIAARGRAYWQAYCSPVAVAKCLYSLAKWSGK